MKNKKIRIAIISSIIILLGIFTYLFFSRNSNTEFNIEETLWIQDNKDSVVSITVPTGLPIFSLDGKGVFFDYIEEFEKRTNVDLGEITEQTNTNYNFRYISNDDIKEGDLVFFTDNYVALSKKEGYNVTSNYIKIQELGAVSKDKSTLDYYLEGYNIKYYDTKEELINAFESNRIEIMLVPRTYMLDYVFAEDINVIHHFNDIKTSYVLSVGEDKELNSILKKVYNTWKEKEDSYYKNLSNLYISKNSIDEITKTNFKSKRYIYGYIKDMPYDNVENYELFGVNGEYINRFTKITGIEFSFKEYSNIEDLISAFNNAEIDMIYSDFSNSDLKMKVELYPHVESNYTILKPKNSNLVIDSIKGLKDETVAVENGMVLSSDLEPYTTVIEYKNPVDSGIKEDYLIALDSLSYEYYRTNKLVNYIKAYEGTASKNYGFVLRDCNENKTFEELFNEFLRTENTKKINLTATTENEFEIVFNETTTFRYIVYIIIILVIASIGLRVAISVLKETKKKKVIQKDEKMKFFDMMTSLKNRNYLNQNIEAWNSNTVYPQTIIIIDLNNIKYINDTHGHNAGDKVIMDAANILINTQLENSDIIRTDGNEFLVYLVGYKEKAVVNYIRKLYKEMKTLPYNYGAEIGYSNITDDIKTIDDAINEATIDMRKSKKEE